MAEDAGILVYYNRLRVLLSVCPSFLICAGMNWFWFGSPAGTRLDRDEPLFATIFTIAAVGLTVAIMLFVLYMTYSAFRPEPYLVVNQEGISIHNPIFPKSLPWSEIQALTTGSIPFTLYSKRYFGIVLRRPSTILIRLNGFQRFIINQNLENLQGAISVSNSIMTIPPAELLKQIGKRYGDVLEQHGVRLVD